MPGGVVFQIETELFFLSAEIARKVMPIPEIARVPGGPPELRGVALVDGDMIPVVDVGDAGTRPSGSGAMLVCTVLGEKVGLVGLDVLATGSFELAPPGRLKYEGRVAHGFDVVEVIASVREGRWAV